MKHGYSSTTIKFVGRLKKISQLQTQAQDRHDHESRRYNEIGHLYQEINSFIADKVYFYKEIGSLKALERVDEPPPEAPFFMPLNNFLNGNWIKEPNTFPTLPFVKEIILITREKMEYIIQESSSNWTKRADEAKKKNDPPLCHFNSTRFNPLGGQDGEILIVNIKRTNISSAIVPSKNDNETLGGQETSRPNESNNSVINIFEQPTLRKLTVKEMVMYFGIFIANYIFVC